MERIPPMQMAKRLARLLRKQRPDSYYLKKVFFHTRKLLEVTPEKKEKRLPQLLTDEELIAFYEAIVATRNRTHMVMIKLMIFTGVRNAELSQIRIDDVDLNSLKIRIEQRARQRCSIVD